MKQILHLGPGEGPAWRSLEQLGDEARRRGQIVVSTNGCFDLLHPGHVRLLQEARAMGDLLVVGLNGDASVRRLKGRTRPLLPQAARAEMLTALAAVDHVGIFDDPTPVRLLERLRPAIHCKGGDYAPEDLPEREPIERYGGMIRIVPRVPGFATSTLVDNISSRSTPEPAGERRGTAADPFCLQAAELLFTVAHQLAPAIADEGRHLAQVLERGGTIMCCGNGGSAGDAQHLAAELVGRFAMVRPGLRAIALCADSSVVTSIANDFGYEKLFSRQVEALGRPGDALVLISTSGNSPNLLEAAQAARRIGITTVGLTGADGGRLNRYLDRCLYIPSRDTPAVQQGHRAVLHAWCGAIEQALARGRNHAA
jgi:D-sedoheptulose 7-phosphate isomerase